MGATAIGTGINAPVGYKEAVVRHLREITGLELVSAGNLVDSTSDTGVFVTFSGALKRSALKLSNDLPLLSAGPQTGFGEISLPALRLIDHARQGQPRHSGVRLAGRLLERRRGRDGFHGS